MNTWRIKAPPHLKSGIQLYDLLKRPEISFSDIIKLGETTEIEPEIQVQLEIHAKYEGYIQKQLKQVEQLRKWKG
jgi:tRNA uridine 5-carboxymethylaminomethyl modification enzyme